MEELEKIAAHVMMQTGWSVAHIKGRWRTTLLKNARHAFCYIAKKTTKCSLQEIGDFLSKRDHSTVINSIQYVEDMLSMPHERGNWEWCDKYVRQHNTSEKLWIQSKEGILSQVRFAYEQIGHGKYHLAYHSLENVLRENKDESMELLTLAADQKMFEEVNG